MELMSAVLMSPDETYGPMQLMTYLAAGEGDLFLLPRDQFVSYASSGTMVTLETDDDLMALLSDAGISVQTGWRRNTETGETHLCGIPLDKLPGLYQYLYAKDGYLCVPVSSKNIENALAFLRILCRDNVTAPAESDSGQPSETVSP